MLIVGPGAAAMYKGIGKARQRQRCRHDLHGIARSRIPLPQRCSTTAHTIGHRLALIAVDQVVVGIGIGGLALYKR